MALCPQPYSPTSLCPCVPLGTILSCSLDFKELKGNSDTGRNRSTDVPLTCYTSDLLLQTGNPYILYKDSCNRKSNQQNLGTIKCRCGMGCELGYILWGGGQEQDGMRRAVWCAMLSLPCTTMQCLPPHAHQQHSCGVQSLALPHQAVPQPIPTVNCQLLTANRPPASDC